ncbi:MAG TPA: hypothetical protein DEG69_04200, partial [Flavobacteriaceae bacterium]|nr:hypothetical protein [Flavobacteriaceae bacterium]
LLFTDSNSEGGTSIKSLDLSNYSTSEVVELDANSEEPFIFFPSIDACNIYEINDSNLFIHAPTGSNFEKVSWLYY